MHNTIPTLLVEDDQVDVMTVKRAIKELGVPNALEVVRNGVEALKFLREEKKKKTCLILLDLNMPKMNGLEFIKELKNDPVLQKCPIIVLTTSNEQQDKQDCFRLSVAGYFVKPVDYFEFVKVIKIITDYWTVSEFPV